MFLNCHSWYSFHYGTLSIEKLLEEAQRLGIRKLVLTDINNTSGVLDFIRLAPKYGVEPVVGIEFRQGDNVRFIGIAKNNEGFEELNRFLSECLRMGAAEGESSGNRDAQIPNEIPCFRNVVVIIPVTLSAPTSSSHKEALHAGAVTRGSLMPEAKGLKPEAGSIFYGIRPSDISRLSFSFTAADSLSMFLRLSLTNSPSISCRLSSPASRREKSGLHSFPFPFMPP